MFSYTGEGLPLNIPQPSIEKMAHEASSGHYMTYSLGNNMVSYQNFPSQRPNFPYVSNEVMKDTFQNVPGVSKDISNQLYPGILYKNHSEIPVKDHLESVPNKFEMASMERTKELLNIPHVKFNSQMVGYQTNTDQKSNFLPVVDQKPTHIFQNKIKAKILKNDCTFDSRQEENILLDRSDQEVCIKQQPLDDDLSTDGQDEDVSQNTHQSEKLQIPVQDTVKKLSKVTEGVDATNTKVVSKSSIETGFFNSFTRDCHGFIKDHIDLTSYRVVESIPQMKNITGSSKQDIYRCHPCNLYFTHPKRFKLHMKWHTFGSTNEQRRLLIEEKERKKKSKKKPLPEDEGGDFICDVCGTGLASVRKLQGHKMRVHKDIPKVCRLCNTTYQTYKQYQDHMKSCHMDAEGKPQRYSCDYCDKTFCTYQSMTRHKGGHLEKKHPCTECEKRFGSVQKLKLHLKSHERVLIGKTLHCSYCGKGFYDTYSLRAHERVHSGDLIYKCDACGSGYATSGSLKRHIKVSHSGGKPFECSVCRRCFKSQTAVKRHTLRAHTPGRPKRVRKKKTSDDE